MARLFRNFRRHSTLLRLMLVALCSIFLMSTPVAAQQPSDVPILTVCEALDHVDDYVGKTVVIVGAELQQAVGP